MQPAATLVLTAGGIALANEALFAPLAAGKPAFSGLNWRIVPATGVLAAVLAGLDTLSPGFGKGLAVLVLVSVLVIPYGNAPAPLDTISAVLGYTKKV